jgi:tRNA-dihydrouridine synthase 3
MSTNLFQGQASEWALLKRHESEDLFGMQLAGSYADQLTKACQLIKENCTVDFVDINCGCPIDIVFDKGAGCALMTRLNDLQKIVRSLDVLLDVPVTAKLRIGIKDNVFTANEIIPQLKTWGVDMITLHGRTRQQRYSKLADWDYIDQCAQSADPVPLFGCGDILSAQDYREHMENKKISGCMIARGALYKPWLFTEIKENRDWDISASERFDMLKRFSNYGLEHWGSDTQGVEATRRFLLEWLSFLYRYIPVGIMERLPQKINERPPNFFGRNQLETLMASPNSQDWVKISEYLLGPVPENFNFMPKHKANSY